MKTNRLFIKYFVILISIIVTYCATTLELYTYQVTNKSKVIDKSIASLNWVDNANIKVLKVRRKGKDILKLRGNFTFAENDTVYILGKSSDRNYLKLFFE